MHRGAVEESGDGCSGIERDRQTDRQTGRYTETKRKKETKPNRQISDRERQTEGGGEEGGGGGGGGR